MIREKCKTLLLLASMVITGCKPVSSPDDRSILSDERFPSPTQLTESDIEWFRGFGVSWIFSENGAPALVLPSLTLIEQAELYDSQNERHLELIDFERVFTSVAIYGALKPGIYQIDSSKIIGEMPTGLIAKTKFELRQAHIDLIRNAWWRDGYIDYKYPYGSYRYYEAEMALKLGQKVTKDSQSGVFVLSDADQQKYQHLHKELLLALLVFVQHAGIQPGDYQLTVDGWKNSFVRLSPPSEQQIQSYIEGAITLKTMLANGQGDKVLGWMKLNQGFSRVIE